MKELIPVMTCRFVGIGERDHYNPPLPKKATILCSVGTEPFKGDKLSSMIALGNTEFQGLTILAGGVLQRWNIALRENISPEEAREEAKAQETAYIKEVEQLINDLPEELKGKCTFEIKGWEDYTDSENFKSDLQELKDELKKNQKWQAKLNKSVEAYLEKHSNIKEKPNAREYVKEYILEESAVFLRLKGPMMYPASCPSFQKRVLKYANGKFSLEGDEKLCWLQLKHKLIKVKNWESITPEKDETYSDTAWHRKLRAIRSSSPKSSPSSSPDFSLLSSAKSENGAGVSSEKVVKTAIEQITDKLRGINLEATPGKPTSIETIPSGGSAVKSASPKSSPSSSPRSSPSSSPKPSSSSSPKSSNALLFLSSKENTPNSAPDVSKTEAAVDAVVNVFRQQKLLCLSLSKNNNLSLEAALRALEKTYSLEQELLSNVVGEINYPKIQSGAKTPITVSPGS